MVKQRRAGGLFENNNAKFQHFYHDFIHISKKFFFGKKFIKSFFQIIFSNSRFSHDQIMTKKLRDVKISKKPFFVVGGDS